MARSLPRRLALLLVVLLLMWAALVAVLAWRAAQQQESEVLQRMSHGLAAHIVEHWPELGAGAPEDPQAHKELLRMLMTVNPGIQVYVLDRDARVQTYIGEPGMVRQPQMDRVALQRFLDGAPLPLYGTNPMGGASPRLFSAAPFAPAPGRSAGYLYVVLDGANRSAVLGRVGQARIWQGVAWAAAGSLLLALLVGVFAVRRLTRPLDRLAREMAQFKLDAPGSAIPMPDPDTAAPLRGGDEVASLAAGFARLGARLREQQGQHQRQAAAHREVIANVAHDLRTPLTALHGHLEALRAGAPSPQQAQAHVDTALAQSDKLRRLTQQLFELATLQSMDQVLHSERFRLDELVADAVQKFGLLAPAGRVALASPAPSAVECDGDLHLIERALTNLIDNALRHSPAEGAVEVSLQCNEAEVAVLVADHGPGLPQELQRRLDAGESVRDPAVRRHAGGGMGGLGLAIAQRIAALHGGRLHTLPAPQGGTRLCLALPRTGAAGR